MLATVSFNSKGMDDGGLVTKEKKTDTVKGKNYTYKIFRQSRTSYEPLHLFVSRAKNKKTGKISFSGGVSDLILNEDRFEYVTYFGGTTDLFNNEYTESKWQELRESYKVQKLNGQQS